MSLAPFGSGSDSANQRSLRCPDLASRGLALELSRIPTLGHFVYVLGRM